MKRLLIGVTAMLIVGAGCTIEKTVETMPPLTEAPTSAPPKTTPKTTDAPIAVAPADDESGFLNAVKSATAVYVSDSSLIDTGEAVCEGARSGTSIDEIIVMIEESSDGNEDTMLLLVAISGAALVFLCPDMAYLLEDL